MKFLIDMPLSPELASWLNQRGHDARHVSAIGMASSSDETILEHASLEKCVIITADLDYPRLLALEQTDGPGLILFRNGDYSERESLERLKTALDAIPEEELPHSIIVIEKSRIRQRRLPV